MKNNTARLTWEEKNPSLYNKDLTKTIKMLKASIYKKKKGNGRKNIINRTKYKYS